MIIFGSNSSHLKSEHLQEIACPHCQNADSIDISVFGKYVHLFWIPFFPMGKVGASQCRHCRQTLKEKEMPENFKAAFKEFKSQLKTPIWHFSGLILLILFIGWSVYAVNQNKKETQLLISDPQVGDVYEYKTDADYYSLMKVTAIEGQSIIFVPNDYEVARESKLNRIDKPENYSPDEYEMSLEDLVELYNTGQIVDVNRK